MAAIPAEKAINAATRRINWRLVLEKTAVMSGCLGALAGAGMIITAVVLISTGTPTLTMVGTLSGCGFFLLALVGAIAGVVGLRMEPPEPPEQS